MSEPDPQRDCHHGQLARSCDRCADAAEIERLRSDAEDDAASRDMMRDILQRTAVALRGPEPPLTRWGWADLPERAAAVVADAERLRSAIARACAGYPADSAAVPTCVAILREALG